MNERTLIRKAKGEVIFSLALAIGGGILLLATSRIRGADQGTRIMPTLYSVIVLVGGIIGVVRALMRAESPLTAPPISPVESADEIERKAPLRGDLVARLDRYPRPMLVAGVIVVYVLLLDRIGYIVSTALLGVALLPILGKKLNRRLVLFCVGMSLVLYAIFEFGLSVRLP